MTDPSQYFKGRTVQEQMNEVIGYVDVRSAEVATDAIASDVAQVHEDMLDADADAAAAAASAAAAAGTLANAVKKTGEASQSIDGDIDLNDDLNVDGDATVGGNLGVTGNLVVTGTATVPTPVNNTDAATKKYVDDADALKADKTYVDAQDALKINITDINTYAVGLSGNQDASGIKNWKSRQNMISPGYYLGRQYVSSPNRSGYSHLFDIAAVSNGKWQFKVTGGHNNMEFFDADYIITSQGSSNYRLMCIRKNYSTGAAVEPELHLCVNGSTLEIYSNVLEYCGYNVFVTGLYTSGVIDNDLSTKLASITFYTSGEKINTLPAGTVDEVVMS